MKAKSYSAILYLAILGACVTYGAEAQQSVMGSGMQPPPFPERRPTDLPDPAAVHGDRHDLDDDPWFSRGAHLSAPVSASLKALLAAAGQKDWTSAKARLLEARALANPTDFDSFEIEVMASFVAINSTDHASALTSYKKMIASRFFATAQTRQEQSAVLKNAMILSNEAGDFSSAIALGDKLAVMGPMDVASAIALAVAYYGNKDYAAAQSLAQKAIDADVAAGKKPDEIALQIVAKSRTNLH